MEVAGIQIASMRSDGTEKMIAVPAQAIGRQDREIIIEPPPWSRPRPARQATRVASLPVPKPWRRWRRSARGWIPNNRTSFRLSRAG
jgi:hypothetical protein